MKTFLKIFGLLFLLNTGCFAEKAYFITVADIHFNPFASCLKQIPCPLIKALQNAPATKWQEIFEKNSSAVMPNYGEDANYFLLKSSLIAIDKIAVEKNASFILLMGDFLGHDYRKNFFLYTQTKDNNAYVNFVAKSFAFLNLEFKAYLPYIPLIPLIGNNDSYGGDYQVIVQGRFLGDIAKQWQTLLKPAGNLPSLFTKAGYYGLDLNNQTRLLILNTVLFTSYDDKNKYRSAAYEELHWLQSELASAQQSNKKIILAMHIPAGINNYAFITGAPRNFWKEKYTAIYNTLLQNYKDTIIAVLSGHIHLDSLGVVSFSHPAEIIFSYTPAISPIYGNNPSFKIYEYDSNSFKLLDYDTYYLKINNWFSHGWQKEFYFYHSF